MFGWGLCCALPLGDAAQAAQAPARAKALVVRRFTLVKERDLSFGNIIPSATQGGTVSVDPYTDARTSTVVTLAGGTAHAARFVGAGTPGNLALVSWRVAPPYTLTRVGGTQTMIVDQLTPNSAALNALGLDLRQVPANSVLDIRFGGRLRVAANQAQGDYEGTFEITVDYY